MGLTDNQIEILGDRIAGLYQELENDVIADIARRVKKTGTYTETAELMAKAMRDTGASLAQIRIKVMKQLHATPEYEAEVARNTLEYKKTVKRAIAETERIAKLTGDEIVANAGDMSFNYDLSMWEQTGKRLTKNSAFTKLVKTMSNNTNETLKNLTKTTGFKVGHATVKIQNAYQYALDKAVLKVATGTFSFDRAAEDCVRELASSGLRSIDYASGRSYQLDTAARMCIRTASAQLASNITMQHCDEMGTDLVEVDSHWGARPEHAVWQGKIYSRSGKNKKYPNFAICRYGEVDGLCGANCRHTFYPFFEGISTPNIWEKEPEPKGYRGKMYTYTEATQKQRQMERNIRATKREIEAVKVMNGDSKILEAKKRKQINEYHDFSSAMGIRAKNNRLRVVTGSSNLTNTKSHKHLKSLAKSGRNVTIKVTNRDVKSAVRERLEASKVKYRQTEKLGRILTVDEVIERLGGGDRTKGSCSSLAFAYIGNRSGMDVLDFRGGVSQSIFSRDSSIYEIANLSGVKSKTVKAYNDIKAVKELLKTVEEEKEYYLSTGAHAAIIRKIKGNFEYLELQSATENGFKKLDINILKKRFKCKKTHSAFGEKREVLNILIDSESLYESQEFKKLLGYINTSTNEQLKGVNGNVK
nr:MAG TPA: minor capsid protein [Caudoviricetes sp.]